jgi:nucleoside-diphosphate-sugar epimerase
MKILITGATGFVGQHLLDELRQDKLSVRVLSRKKDPVFWFPLPGMEIVQCDLGNEAGLGKAFEGIDVIVNLAAEIQDADKFESTNIKGAEHIIAAAKKNGIKKIVHLSSVGVAGMQYSRKRVIVDEHFPCDPKNGYERSKLAAEKLLGEFSLNDQCALHILRPTNVFGDHHPRRALLRLLTKLHQGGSFPVMKGAMVNYVYVKDVAAAIRHFIVNDPEERIVNVGEAVLLRDFLEMGAKIQDKVLKTVDLSPAFFSLPGSMMKGPLERLKGLSNKVEYSDVFMKHHIGYRYGLREGLERTIRFYTDQRLLK